MSKKMKGFTPIILKMIHEGYSYSEIAGELGLKNDTGQNHQLVLNTIRKDIFLQ